MTESFWKWLEITFQFFFSEKLLNNYNYVQYTVVTLVLHTYIVRRIFKTTVPKGVESV